jgi:hypothetical protein
MLLAIDEVALFFLGVAAFLIVTELGVRLGSWRSQLIDRPPRTCRIRNEATPPSHRMLENP